MTVGASGPAAEGAAPQSLSEWLRYLETLNVTEINLGLERMNEVADRLGLTQPAAATFTVAGTNGKGSSAALLDAIYREAGYKVGMYTSPHLIRYTERIRIDGREVEDADLCDAFARIEAARGDLPLTYFEFGTLAAFMLFAEAAIDVWVLEVGLGGRLDAVNWVDADVAIVTSIGLDHTEWLGDTREAIGREKAGVFREGRWAVSSDPDTPDSVFAVARETAAKLTVLGVDYGVDVASGCWDFWSKTTDSQVPALPNPGLPGRFQFRNFAGVLQAVQLMQDRLPLTAEVLRRAVAGIRLPGRFQSFSANGLEYILDVAHNPQAATALAENLNSLSRASRTHAVVGMLSDKDHRGVVGILAPFTHEFYFVSLPSPRATAADTLVAECSDLLVEQGASGFVTVAEALDAVHARSQPGDRVVISGSFVTVGEALRDLESRWGVAPA